MIKINLFNTASRKLEEFEPIVEGEVGIYTCGPTVYDYAHIGNLRSYVFSDTLKRMFLLNGYKVNQIINLTDVGHLTGDSDEGEDKLEKGAKRENKTVWEVADFYIKDFKKTIKQLNVISPNVFCRATDHINEMIELIKKLEKNGFTYISGDNVYFDTAKFPAYGDFAKLNLDPEAAKSRVEEDTFKKNPFDFVLWFTRYKYMSHEMIWDSPWGKGFPGWHIECSAMASKYLGEHFDIHTGGIDHISVHHTNEIAQSEAAFSHKWVNYWMHNDFITVKGGEKMAKSSGGFMRLTDLIEQGYSPLDYRYYLLGGLYRSPLAFSLEALNGAQNALNRIRVRVAEFKKSAEKERNEALEVIYKNEFLAVVSSDLNTSKGLALVWKVIDDVKVSPASKLEVLAYFDQLLGLDLLKEVSLEEVSQEIKALAQERVKLRQEKKWLEADEVRGQIAGLGYEVLDTEDGYELKKK